MTDRHDPLAGMVTKAIAKTVLLNHEAGVLGGVLLRPEVLGLLHFTEVEDFHSPKHQAVFIAMRNLEASGRPIDVLMVEAELQRLERLEAVGGLAFLGVLVLRVPSPDNVVHYARELREGRLLRETVRRLVDVIEIVADKDMDHVSADEVVSIAFRSLQSIETGDLEAARSMGAVMAETMTKFLDNVGARSRGERIYAGMPTGMRKLDEKIGGILIGVPTLLMARPSDGKTTVIDHWAEAAYDLANDEPIIASWEDGEESFAYRRLGRASGIDTRQIQHAEVSAEQVATIQAAYDRNRLGERTEIFLDAGGKGLDVDDLCRYVRSERLRAAMDLKAGRRKRTRGRLVVVDYIQRMFCRSRRFENRHQEVAYISRSLTRLCAEEKIALVVGSQSGRAAIQRDNKEPQMADAKECGNLEEDAKLFIGLHWPHRWKSEKPEWLLEMHILKNSNGPINKVIEVYWDRPTHTVVDELINLPQRRRFVGDAPPPGRFADDAPPYDPSER